jgi:hypothetical protein
MAHPEVRPGELSGFAQISRRIITLARMLGWDVRWSGVSKQNVILRSDDGKRLVIPPTNVNVNRAQSWIRAILRHTAPAKIRNLYRGGTGINLARDPDAAEIVAAFGVELKLFTDAYDEAREAMDRDTVSQEVEEEVVPRVAETVVMEGPVDVKYQGAGSDSYGSDWWVRIHPDGKQEYVCKAHDEEYVAQAGLRSIGPHNRHHMPGAREHVESALAKASEAMREKRLQEKAAAPVPEETQEQVHVPLVLARRPWLARLSNSGRGAEVEGPGMLYESPYVDVVTLSDGNEVYECRQCQQFQRLNPRAVANHSAKTHGVIKTDRTPIRTSNYQPSGLHRSQTPVTRLSHEIVHALDTIEGWRDMESLELANTIASVMVEARPDRAPVEPLTDQQILARIGALLDRGQLAEVHQQMEQLAKRLRESEALADTAARRAARAESNLSALRDLLNETREEES